MMNHYRALIEVFEDIGVEFEERPTSSGKEVIIRGEGSYLGLYHSFEFDRSGQLFLHGSYND